VAWAREVGTGPSDRAIVRAPGPSGTRGEPADTGPGPGAWEAVPCSFPKAR
jgi:hypothetical protein